MGIPSWIYHNLFEYKNCLIPNKLIDEYGIESVIKTLEYFTGYEIDIDKYVNNVLSTDLQFQSNKDVNFIAIVRGVKKWKQ